MKDTDTLVAKARNLVEAADAGVVTLNDLEWLRDGVIDYFDLRPALASLDGMPRSHADGPDTEKAAARLAWPGAEGGRRRVLLELERAGHYGRTADELEVILDMRSAPQRLNDLKAGGWVQPVGRQRTTRSGAHADVYTLSAPALRQRQAERHVAA